MRKLALNLRREVSPSKFDKIIISGGAFPENIRRGVPRVATRGGGASLQWLEIGKLGIILTIRSFCLHGFPESFNQI